MDLRGILPDSWIELVILLIVLTGFSACDNSADIDEARTEVERIRNLVREVGFEGMYEYASPKFKEVVDKKEFVKELNKYRELVGKSENFELFSSGVRYDPIYGKQVLLSYVPIVKSEILEEKFLFAKEGENLKLINYNYDTPK